MDELNDQLWDLLWEDVDGPDQFPSSRPLLAHYTSASIAEEIFRKKELWLSHPVLMNDVQELKWGIQAGKSLLWKQAEVKKACKDEHNFDFLNDEFDRCVDHFDQGSAHSIFVACFSRHEKDDHDGLLSMWRAYGSNGEGVAIVFDTEKIKAQDNSPFVLAPVKYETDEGREVLVENELRKIAKFLDENHGLWNKEFLTVVAYYFLEKLKLISLTTKHSGFAEEKEWRLIYLPDRDEHSEYLRYIGYFASPSGFQPKLKLPLTSDIPWMNELPEIISEVILGPAHGSILAEGAFRRMLDLNQCEQLCQRLHRSSIPFRPRL